MYTASVPVALGTAPERRGAPRRTLDGQRLYKADRYLCLTTYSGLNFMGLMVISIRRSGDKSSTDKIELGMSQEDKLLLYRWQYLMKKATNNRKIK